jgi:thiamine pyrophosphate-dependent acetolactate synthase large subunit-like protein
VSRLDEVADLLRRALADRAPQLIEVELDRAFAPV